MNLLTVDSYQSNKSIEGINKRTTGLLNISLTNAIDLTMRLKRMRTFEKTIYRYFRIVLLLFHGLISEFVP